MTTCLTLLTEITAFALGAAVLLVCFAYDRRVENCGKGEKK